MASSKLNITHTFSYFFGFGVLCKALPVSTWPEFCVCYLITAKCAAVLSDAHLLQ